MSKYQIKNEYSDEDFLKKIITSVSFLSQAMPNQMITIKNCASEHIFCSDYLAQLIGIDTEEMIGKKVWLPLYDNAIEFETIITEEDQTIINSRLPKIVFKINRFKSGLTPYTSFKSPLINPSNNHVVGILFQGFEMGTLNFKQYFAKISSVSKGKDSRSSNLPDLSKREKQVIFFFLANLSSQEIAETLYQIDGKKISKSTIDSLFNDQLYPKFMVYSRPALYKKLQEMGYEKRIPEELLSSTSIAIDVMKSY